MPVRTLKRRGSDRLQGYSLDEDSSELQDSDKENDEDASAVSRGRQDADRVETTRKWTIG